MLTLILGGARSGKSVYAERLASEGAGENGPVLYIATAEALDDEMAQRIRAHQQSRPTHWQTLEEPRAVARALSAYHGPAVVWLLDCITLWVSNLILIEGAEALAEDAADALVQQALTELLECYRRSQADLILVSNEVGMGLVPPYPLGRLYRDLLGRANMRLASAADRVILLVAGLPLALKSPNT